MEAYRPSSTFLSSSLAFLACSACFSASFFALSAFFFALSAFFSAFCSFQDLPKGCCHTFYVVRIYIQAVGAACFFQT